MGITLAPEHLKRYKDIARLFFKYGDAEILPEIGLDSALIEGEPVAKTETEAKADALADDLEEMGPLYVKLGQVLSSRGDLLPTAYVKALTRLQDKTEPFPYEEVEKILEQEMGVRISKAFQEFEKEPIASASLGQVHRAVLHNGQPVAVKVQRPGIRKQVAEDLEVLEEIARFADSHTEAGRRYHFTEILEEFRITLARELDYLQEARNLVRIDENLKEFERIVVPQPVMDYTTSHVLTMDYIQGRKITAIGPLRRMEIDGMALAEDLFRAYLQQILVDGVFHADPHPGNVFLTGEGKLALLDMGMVGHVAPDMQEHLLKLLIAISEGRGDEAADLAIKIGDTLEEFDETRFRRRVAEIVILHQDAEVKDINVGRVMLEFSRVAGESGIRMPAELTLLSKALLNLDEIGRILDPEFDPNAAIRRHAAEILRQRMMKSLSLGNIVATAMEAQEFAREMPGRVNRILDLVSRNQLKINVDAFDETTLIEGFQKVANRITTGLVIAALIIGAAMLMRVQTTFQLFGYPGLAMICFLAAAAGGIWLLLTIVMSDRIPRRKSKSEG